MHNFPFNPAFPFEIVGFDLDGTLLDTHADLGVALNHALGLIGREPIPLPDVRPLIGGGGRQMMLKALARTGGAEGIDIEALYEQLIAYYEEHIAVHTRLFPGGEAMLADLESRGVKLAVVTNKLERLAMRLLDELGLSHRLFTIIGGDTMGPGRAKPSPDPLMEMVARARGPREGRGGLYGVGRAAYVGDTTFDTLAARAARMPCVAVSFGFCDMPAGELGADAVIDHYDELVPALQRL